MRPIFQAIAGAVRAMRAIAHSKGGHDLGQYLSQGRTELAQALVNGQPSAMHTPTPHHSQEPQVQPMSRGPTPAVQPSQTATTPQPNWEAIKAQAQSQMKNIQMPASAAPHGQVLQLHNVRLDPQRVTHSEPITPQPTPMPRQQASSQQQQQRSRAR